MPHDGRRFEYDLKTACTKAEREIRVFVIGKEFFIEERGFDRGDADECRRAGRVADLVTRNGKFVARESIPGRITVTEKVIRVSCGVDAIAILTKQKKRLYRADLSI